MEQVNLEPVVIEDLAKFGEDRGRLEGELRTLVHQFERRLGRSLRTEEHRTLRTRVVQLGSDRLGDVVMDLPSETLAAWLAAPDAT
jgi:hypothetical protein